MKLIIAGSRELFGPRIHEIIENRVPQFSKTPTEIVCGKARGVDTMGEEWAIRNGILVRPFPADWKRYGNLAGPTRNQQMADYADALLLIYLPGSNGSLDMLRRAKVANLEIVDVMLQW